MIPKPVPCPNCRMPVIAVTTRSGSVLALNARPSNLGKLAVRPARDREDSQVHVRGPLAAGEKLQEGERRYKAHTCGQEAARAAQSAQAKAARNRRGHPKASRSPLAGASGVRIPAPGRGQ